MSIKAEYLAVDALAAWLRLQLPAEVAAVNLTRQAVLRAPVAGPYTIPGSASLKLSLTKKDDPAPTSCALTSGSQSAATLATNVNTAMGASVASADSDGRFVLTSTVAPSGTTPSAVSVLSDSTGANAALGWDAGGEYVVNPALVAPGHRNVMDGWPQVLDAKAGFIVVIGRRSATPIDPQTRRMEHVVTLELALFRPATQQENHRNREAMHACLQCVRDVLTTDDGRQLGHKSTGDIVLVELGKGVVEAMRFQPMQKGKPFGPAFDSAALTVYVKTYERTTSN